MVTKLKEPITVIKVLAWLLVFGVSVYALIQANKSIRLATESNDIARRALASGQRPYISVKPVKFDDGKFLFLKEINGGIAEKFRFELSNKGNSVAQHIVLTPVVISSVEPFPANPKIVVINDIKCMMGSGAIALAPAESTILEISGNVQFSSKDAISDMARRFEAGELPIPFNIEVTYDSDVLSTKGKTGLSLVFWPDRVETNYSVLE